MAITFLALGLRKGRAMGPRPRPFTSPQPPVRCLAKPQRQPASARLPEPRAKKPAKAPQGPVPWVWPLASPDCPAAVLPVHFPWRNTMTSSTSTPSTFFIRSLKPASTPARNIRHFDPSQAAGIYEYPPYILDTASLHQSTQQHLMSHTKVQTAACHVSTAKCRITTASQRTCGLLCRGPPRDMPLSPSLRS